MSICISSKQDSIFRRELHRFSLLTRLTSLIFASLILILSLVGCSVKNQYKELENVIYDSEGNYECLFDGRTRRFVVVVPAGATSDSPLLFMLHGASGTSDGFMLQTDMNEVASDRGFVLVYPQGVGEKEGTASAMGWNNNLSSEEGNDDVGFITAIAQYIEDILGYGKTSRALLGFSNGGFLAYRIAIERPELFDAIISVCGTIMPSVWDEKSNSRDSNDPPISILQINGTEDDVVPLDDASIYGGRTPHMDKIIEYWIDFLDLDQESAISLSDIVTATTYYSSTSRNRFTYVLIDGGRHSWPDSSSVGFDVRTFILDYCESSFS